MSTPPLKRFPTVLSNDRRERELDLLAGTAPSKTVRVLIGTIVPLLIDAAQNDRAWLDDFADDTVQIDADLYEVLLAYQQLGHRSAA